MRSSQDASFYNSKFWCTLERRYLSPQSVINIKVWNNGMLHTTSRCTHKKAIQGAGRAKSVKSRSDDFNEARF
jgi:hypothetical protein